MLDRPLPVAWGGVIAPRGRGTTLGLRSVDRPLPATCGGVIAIRCLRRRRRAQELSAFGLHLGAASGGDVAPHRLWWRGTTFGLRPSRIQPSAGDSDLCSPHFSCLWPEHVKS